MEKGLFALHFPLTEEFVGEIVPMIQNEIGGEARAEGTVGIAPFGSHEEIGVAFRGQILFDFLPEPDGRFLVCAKACGERNILTIRLF